MIHYVVTSPLSLARLLWWYGEDDLWRRALDLSPQAVAYLAEEFADLRERPDEVAKVWRDAPALDAYLLLPTIELLEGAARPAVRRQRRPDRTMPSVLDVEDEKRWRDPQLIEVAQIIDARTGTLERFGEPADRPRYQGRWAPW